MGSFFEKSAVEIAGLDGTDCEVDPLDNPDVVDIVGFVKFVEVLDFDSKFEDSKCCGNGWVVVFWYRGSTGVDGEGGEVASGCLFGIVLLSGRERKLGLTSFMKSVDFDLDRLDVAFRRVGNPFWNNPPADEIDDEGALLVVAIEEINPALLIAVDATVELSLSIIGADLSEVWVFLSFFPASIDFKSVLFIIRKGNQLDVFLNNIIGQYYILVSKSKCRSKFKFNLN